IYYMQKNSSSYPRGFSGGPAELPSEPGISTMERVVVTGIGLVTPNGIGTSQTWESLIRGESAVGPITLFDADERYPSRIAAEVKNFDPAAYMPKKKIKEVSRFIPFSMGATHLALEEANLDLTDEERERVGVFIGVGLGGLENLERCT